MQIPTVGVEEEFLLLGSRGRSLSARGQEVVDLASARDPDGQFEHELQKQQVELGSSPTRSLTDLSTELRRLRSELASAGAAQGARLLASATSPVPARPVLTEDPRYRRMRTLFGTLAGRQLTCGMHVHVSVESPENGVAIIDRLRPWLPVITALSANSPFLLGEDTGYASYRSMLWGQWPSAGQAEPFGDLATYRAVVGGLVATGAALDDGMIYFDARLSASYPTVEIRVADVCLDGDDAAVLAGIIRGLVMTAGREDLQPAAWPRSEVQRAAAWRAARFGTDDELVQPLGRSLLLPAWDVVSQLLDTIRPALLDAGDLQQVEEGLERIRRRGTGARVQRQAYAAGGMAAVLDAVACG